MKWLKRLLRGLLLDVAYDTKPSELQLFLEHQQRSEVRYHERISDLLAAMQARGNADNERIAELIGTLDKIVAVQYDKPVIASDNKPNTLSYPLPTESLTDVISDGDDAAFIAKSEVFFQ